MVELVNVVNLVKPLTPPQPKNLTLGASTGLVAKRLLLYAT